MDYHPLLIGTLRAKQYITPLEKNILDTWNGESTGTYMVRKEQSYSHRAAI